MLPYPRLVRRSIAGVGLVVDELTILRMNIERYYRSLEFEDDSSKRLQIFALLREAEATEDSLLSGSQPVTDWTEATWQRRHRDRFARAAILPNVFDLRLVRRARMLPAIGRAKAQHNNNQTRIGQLIFRCPAAESDIESGVHMDQRTFEKIREITLRVCCRACQQ